MYKAKNPILIIIFNRPKETKKVLSALRSVQPMRLYVAADAPRSNRPEEGKKCIEALEVFREVDWPCEIIYKLNKFNLGSHTTIPRAIDWFFDNEDMGIVLEDDCIPSEGFFRFCDELLLKYKNDERVMWINGSNIGFKDEIYNSSYHYSAYAISWGWASWRRAWSLFNNNYRDNLEDKVLDGILRRNAGYSLMARLYWRYVLKYAYTVKNWDFRWLFALWGNGGLACTPTLNMVSNVGFGIEGVHGGKKNDQRGHIPIENLSEEIVAPEQFIPNAKLDEFLNRNLYKVGMFSILKAYTAYKFPWIRNALRRFQNK